MPALPSWLAEPLWDQFAALLPPREVFVPTHPWGCHRRRIGDRIVFDKLVQVPRFGCSYEAIADTTCSATTLRARRDEWIALGVFAALARIAREAYDRIVGLLLDHLAVDGCITKAPGGGECAGPSPVDRRKQGLVEGVEVRAQVRDRYAAAATAVVTGGAASRCGVSPDGAMQDVEVGDGFGAQLYGGDDRAGLPAEAVAASLGCGNPLAVTDLHEGETVLDLGSGGGIDVLLSARRVGPTGKAYGVDMTDEMLALARTNAEQAGATIFEFVKGTIEAVPLPDASVDVVISNCVISLSTDKLAVLAEAHRLLRPGGRFGVSDVVAEDHLDPAQRAERGSYVGCIAGALSMSEYRDGLAAAGFVDITITPTHQVADGMHSAIIRAHKPAGDSCCGVHGCCTPREHAIDIGVTVTDGKVASGCGCVSPAP